MRIWSALLTCWSMRVVSVGRTASIFSLFWRKPDSNRLNQGSMRMVLLPKVISQPLVPNHLKLTPAVPGPPPPGRRLRAFRHTGGEQRSAEIRGGGDACRHPGGQKPSPGPFRIHEAHVGLLSNEARERSS